jgi:hypothetical protein
MIILSHHSSSITHQIKYRQLQSQDLIDKGRARASLNRRRRYHRSRNNPNSTRCPPWMGVTIYETERWIHLCSVEGRRNLVSDREARVRACMLTLNRPLLAVGAEAHLMTGNLSTLGYQRRGSIINSKREGEDDDENIR